jgi:hypothetical protein
MLYKRRVLAFKVEVTPGTAETLTTTECVFCFDPVMQGDIPQTDRVATGSLSRLASVPGARKGTITFDIEMANSGIDATTDPKWAGLLTACGMKLTAGVYTFTSDTANYKTLTIGLYEDGLWKLMTGAMGTWSLEAENGKPGMIKFSFDGIWQPPTDAAMLALPSYSVVPPRFAAATFSIGAITPKISKLSLESGNTIKLVEDITKISGYNRAVVTDRKVGGKIDPESLLVAGWDVFGQWISGLEAALTLTVGTAGGGQISITGAKAQISNVQEAQRELLVTNDIDYQMNATSAGDDELSISFL